MGKATHSPFIKMHHQVHLCQYWSYFKYC